MRGCVERGQANHYDYVYATATYRNNTVSLTAADIGALYNSVALKSSNAAEISTSATHLTGGQDNAYIAVNAIKLTQGTDWFALDVASNTAYSLAAAINSLYP